MKKYVACKYASPSGLFGTAMTGTATTLTPTTSPSVSFGSVLPGSTTLTPTTLRNLEQTFIELQSVPSRTMVQNPIPRSGFVPPNVQSTMHHSSLQGSDHEMYSDLSNDSSSCEDYLPSQTKKIRIGERTSTIMSKYEIENPQRKTHRRQIRDDDITPEAAARLGLKRERNKVAAAKCRQRRVDHTNRLLGETEKLERYQQSMKQEILELQQQKEQLQYILQSHHPLCKGSKSISVIKVKKEPAHDQPENLKILSNNSKKDNHVTSRPSSLSLLKHDLKTGLPSAGVTLMTPSSGFCSLTLDTMVDHTGLTPLTGNLGHTGFTPVTTMPQSCSSEVSKKQSISGESSDRMKSNSNLIAYCK